MLRSPLPGTPPPAPRGKFSSLTVAARGLLRRHGCALSGARSPPLRSCNAARRPPSPNPLHKSRPKKNARFSFAGKYRHLAILRAPRPAPAPSGARFGAETAPGCWLAFPGTSVSGRGVLPRSRRFLAALCFWASLPTRRAASSRAGWAFSGALSRLQGTVPPRLMG